MFSSKVNSPGKTVSCESLPEIDSDNSPPGIDYLTVEKPQSPTVSEELKSPPSAGGVYGSYAPLHPKAPTKLQAPTERYNYNKYQSLPKKRPELSIEVPSAIFYYSNSDTLPETLDAYQASSYLVIKNPPKIYFINNKHTLVEKKSTNKEELAPFLDSLTTTPDPDLIIEFTGLPTNTAELINSYITIHSSDSLNKQLTPKKINKLKGLLCDSLHAFTKQVGTYIEGEEKHSIDRSASSTGTGKSEPGPRYDRITGKAVTVLNIRYFDIQKKLNPQNPETLFQAYERLIGPIETMTRQTLDQFVDLLPSEPNEWKEFKSFYQQANMIFLDEKELPKYELQYTKEGLATLSEENPHRLFDEKVQSINGRQLADTTNRSDKKEIHGENTAIYVLVQDPVTKQKKIIIARDTVAIFHHNSIREDNVISAGTLTIKDGKITMISNESGHYKPTEQLLKYVLKFLIDNGATAHLETIKITRKKILFFNEEKTSMKDLKTCRIGSETQIITGKEKINEYLLGVKLGNTVRNQLAPKSPLRERAKQRAFSPRIFSPRTFSPGPISNSDFPPSFSTPCFSSSSVTLLRSPSPLNSDSQFSEPFTSSVKSPQGISEETTSISSSTNDSPSDGSFIPTSPSFQELQSSPLPFRSLSFSSLSTSSSSQNPHRISRGVSKGSSKTLLDPISEIPSPPKKEGFFSHIKEIVTKKIKKKKPRISIPSPRPG
jgi:hypothetical protein